MKSIKDTGFRLSDTEEFATDFCLISAYSLLIRVCTTNFSAEAVPLPTQLVSPSLPKLCLCWICSPPYCPRFNYIICTSRQKSSFPPINRATIYISRHGDISATKNEAPKRERTPMSRRTIGFHFIHVPLQAGQSFPVFSFGTSAAGERNKSPAQPDALTPAMRKDLWIPSSVWPSSLQASLRGHTGGGCSLPQIAFIDILFMFLRRGVSVWMDSQVSASVHLSGRM